MKRAITFYTNILGLKLISESADFSQIGGEKFWIALQINATTVDERSKSDGPIIVFKTNDIKQKYHELKTKGVKFHKPPYDVVPELGPQNSWIMKGINWPWLTLIDQKSIKFCGDAIVCSCNRLG